MFTEKGRRNFCLSSGSPQRGFPLLPLMYRKVAKGNKCLPLVLFGVKSSLQNGCLALRQPVLCYEFERSHIGETRPNTEKGINIFPNSLRPNLRWGTRGVGDWEVFVLQHDHS